MGWAIVRWIRRGGESMSETERRAALVTGGGVRVGREIVTALGRAGYDVAVHFHSSASAAAETVAKVQTAGGRAASFRADLRDPAQIDAMVEEAAAFLGRLDLLVCSAATFRREPPDGLSATEWDDVFDLNARAPYLCVRASLPYLGADASIVNVADVAGLESWPGYVTYAASKAALISLTRGLASALAPNVRVNAVAPGPVLPTEDADEAEREALDELTLPGLKGTASDVASAVLYLADASYVTGQVLRVDGGQRLR